MAIKRMCDGCGTDITPKKFTGADGIERMPKIGGPGDGLERGVKIWQGTTFLSVDLCSTCLELAAEALTKALPKLPEQPWNWFQQMKGGREVARDTSVKSLGHER